jgi:hypothetical protein
MSDIRWCVVIAQAPMGGADKLVAEFTAPTKTAALAERDRRVADGTVPAGTTVLSRLEYELYLSRPKKPRPHPFRRRGDYGR